ncbi:MAG: pyridoxamine 5'-phosphate oxidase family protein [Burkholderiaceae bacterium]
MPIDSLQALLDIYGEPTDVARRKQIDRLDEHCRRFIALSPFLVMATSDGERLDASPKGDEPGFVHVEDDHHLLIPDWPGNRRIDGLRNLIRDPAIGLIFMIPNVEETLRVNGRATIHAEPDVLARFERGGRLPLTVTRVRCHEVFLHCAKAFMRSRLWHPERWPERAALPSMVEMLRDHARMETTPDDAQMRARLRDTLY